MTNPLRLALAGASLRYYRWTRRRWRREIVAAFAGTATAPAWVPLSAWLAAAPRRERIMMMVGPRWNTAAVLAFTPTFEARARVTIDAGEARRACEHWGVVVYDEGLRTIAALGNRSAAHDWSPIELAPGRYFLALRYYEPAAQARFPGVRVDGEPLVEATPVGEEPARYAAALRGLARRFAYRLMHYHAWAMLRERAHFDEATLRRHYLPVGNPETEFAYGAVAAGERLRIEPSPAAGARTYVTFYGVDSLPRAWHTLDAGTALTPPAPARGTYLVRHLRPDSDTINGIAVGIAAG